MNAYTNHFSTYHPIIVFLYYLSIMVFIVTLTHPAFLVAGLFMWLIYVFLLIGTKAFFKSLLYIVPLALFITIINPLFNHKGDTPILYYNNIPITLEALCYGLFTSVMLISLIYLFRAFDRCITPHKFVYLFGKTIPTIALMITMIMRFIPHFTRKLSAITQTQECLGVSTKHGSLRNRLFSGNNIISVLVSFSLEGTIDTADSMKARGYQLKGKTHYHTYICSARDFALLFFLIVFDFLFASIVAMGSYRFHYYPSLTEFAWNTKTVILILLYMIFMGIPLIINLLEDIRWKLSRAKI